MPTSHYFKQLLKNDTLNYNSIAEQLSEKKKKIDNIVARYNKAVSLQGCEERLGLLHLKLSHKITCEDKFKFNFHKHIINSISLI